MTDEQVVALMATLLRTTGFTSKESCVTEACDLFAAVQLERKRLFTANGMDEWMKENGNA